MLFNWLPMLNAVIFECPELFPVILSDDKNVDEFQIEVEKSLFKFVQEGYNEHIQPTIQLCAFARAIVSEFAEFVGFIKWYKSQPFRDGGGDGTDTQQIIEEFFTNSAEWSNINDIHELLIDRYNSPTPTSMAYTFMAYRIGYFSECYVDDIKSSLRTERDRA